MKQDVPHYNIPLDPPLERYPLTITIFKNLKFNTYIQFAPNYPQDVRNDIQTLAGVYFWSALIQIIRQARPDLTDEMMKKLYDDGLPDDFVPPPEFDAQLEPIYRDVVSLAELAILRDLAKPTLDKMRISNTLGVKAIRPGQTIHDVLRRK